MGIFDFFKTEEEKEQDEAIKILKRIAERKKARNEAGDELISSAFHDNLVTNGQISTGVGRFGLDVTNPIPVRGFSGLDDYFDKLNIKKKITWESSRLGSTSAQNINGNIDIYNLTAADGSSLKELYVCMYCNETSFKIPEGF